MKQLVQNLRRGELELLDVPCPRASAGHLLVQTRASLISAGTERGLLEFGRAGLIGKALQAPERVREVWQKIKTDGFSATKDAVFRKLDQPMSLGYCNAGVVVEVGAGVEGFQPGDRVASNGQHAEMVHVPVNLAAKIPAGVSDDEASFAVLGSIALHGIRLLAPTIGERVAVFGLGLVGLVAVQILKASGVQVLGIDLDPARLAMARQFGAETLPAGEEADAVSAALSFSGGVGVDGVLITAAAKNDDIAKQSAKMTRKRGRIVLVGVVDCEFDRRELFDKEITFQVSCSYGPGRYDPQYESRGLDYPLPYVRWTEQRNIEAVLSMMAQKQLDVAPLITSRVPHSESEEAYGRLLGDRKQLGIVLQYSQKAPPMERVVRVTERTAHANSKASATGKVIAGLIGAGGFVSSTLLPALVENQVTVRSIASASGTSAAHAARKFNIQHVTSDYRTILADQAINTVFIATPHHLHAKLVAESLAAGKHVFVEKPLAISEADMEIVEQALADDGNLQLLVGFNRRFAPLTARLKQLLQTRTQPATFIMTVNAGKVDAKHWQQDASIGGGRLLGEACHWFDLISFLAGSPIASVQADCLRDANGQLRGVDHSTITLGLADGSLGTIHYFANGHKGFPKERLEVFCEGKIAQLDNFRRLTGYGWKSFRREKHWRQDKGHKQEIARFVSAIAQGGPPVIPPAELLNVTRATLAAQRAMSTREVIAVS